MAHASRFRAMLAELGLTHPDAAQLLHVSLRTLQNWLSGRHEVPYAAYKLLRLMRYMELPGDAWAGWHFSRGHLVTPEGRTISGRDCSWWSLLVRQAEGFGKLYRENLALKADLAPAARSGGAEERSGLAQPLRAAGSPVLAPSGSGVPVTRHFSPFYRTFDQNFPRYEIRQTLQKASFELSRRSPAGAMGGLQRP